MSCCKDCEKRYLGCHDSCEDFKDFKKQKKLINEREREHKGNSAGWDGYHMHAKKKLGVL